LSGLITYDAWWCWPNWAAPHQQGENMDLLNRRWLSSLLPGAASILLLAMFSSAAFAGVIYQYRQDGSASDGPNASPRHAR
jgi:hypothetical protein